MLLNMASSIRQAVGLVDPIGQAFFESTPVAMIICDADGIIYAANLAAHQLFETSFPLQGESIHQLVDHPNHPALVKEFVENPRAFGTRVSGGRCVTGKTMSGEPINVCIYLGHTLWENTRLANAVILRCTHELGTG